MNKTAINIENLTKDFSSIRALDNLSLEIPTGTIFGFLGPNGAGKTTTIRLLLGLLDPTSGRANVLGFDTRTQANHIRVQTGALLENTGIYEQMSAEDNLEFYGRVFRIPQNERKLRIQKLLISMGLWERRKDRAGKWSKGMKQKLALARTLLHQPRLVLLDEPTSGLDVEAAVSIRENLLTLATEEDVTIFLTTHNMTDAEKLCHQIGIIREGKLLALGKPEKLKSKIGSTHVEVSGKGFNTETLKRLRAHQQISEIHTKNNHLVIDLKIGASTSSIVNFLVGAGIQVEEVRRQDASLEDVYLSIIGERDV